MKKKLFYQVGVFWQNAHLPSKFLRTRTRTRTHFGHACPLISALYKENATCFDTIVPLFLSHFYSKSWSQSKKIIRTCRLSRESCCSRCNVDHRKFVHWSSDCNSGLFLIILEIHFSDFLVIFMPFSNKDIILNNWIPMKKKNEFQVRISLVSKCTKLKWA